MSLVWLDKLSFAQRQRLQFIEAMLIWEGSVQRADVCKVFKITPNHLTRDFKRYISEHEHALEYKPATRAYHQGHKFKPLLASGSATEYLTLLQAYSVSGTSTVLPAMGHIAQAEAIEQPTGSIDADVLRLIMQALRQKTGVSLLYQSFSDIEPIVRTLWPHTLVFNGARWHVRAYDDRRKQFRDFVLTRCSNPKGTTSPSPLASSEDTEWNERELVEVMPATRLSPTQQNIIAREFGMVVTSDGSFVWRREIRKCLVGYFLDRHRLERGGSTGAKSTVGQHPYLMLHEQKLAAMYRFGSD